MVNKQNFKDYVQILRIKHYIKNLLLFVPLFFDQKIFDTVKLKNVFWGFLSFSLISSVVYILNDLFDVEKDRKHLTKRSRPIAAGRIKRKYAIILCAGCFFGSFIIFVQDGLNRGAIVFLLLYFLLNIFYSAGLKNKPIIDIVILASGFVIRILFGALLAGTDVSVWLYLVIVTGSFYVSLGKRRNELEREHEDTRVLRLPVEVIFPGIFGPYFFHSSSTSISSCKVPFPAFSSCTDFFT